MSEAMTYAEKYMEKMLQGKALNTIHNIAQDEKVNGATVKVNGTSLHFFGNCSYLGIESDERVKYKSIEAILQYGTFFSSSRTYISLQYLQEVEQKLEQLFEQPVLIAQTTGLAHIAWIPLLATKGDVIILDHQVHRSVQNAVQMVKASGVQVEQLRHNRIDMLEDKIVELSKHYNKVWYMADSVYSMYGDVAPLAKLEHLLDQYDQFYMYIDDAHGMSWTGKNGKGYALSQIAYHPKMCLATSLVKGFGGNGAALVFPNEKMKEQVKLFGSPFIFSGAPPPAALGAIHGATAIHLSDEIYEKQNKLNVLMTHFIDTCHQFHLPLVREDITPVFYIGIGDNNNAAFHIVNDLKQAGYFVNISSFPSVPLKNEGIRITLTIHLTKEVITGLLATIAELLERYGLTSERILPAFQTKKEKKITMV
jgi:7-keto-8-aminopelargonate synthetase-like enzyme